jgi:hypothetical protein
MPRSRSLGAVGLVVVGAVVALVGGVAGLAVWSRTDARDVGAPGGAGLRRLGDTGVSVAVPSGWVDHRRAAPGALLLEVEERLAPGVPLATRGLWVGRWHSADPATELSRLKASKDGGRTWTDGPRVAGLASVVHEEAIGPSLVRRLPAGVTMHRRELRVVAYGDVYQIGVWGSQSTLDDGVERAVLARVRIDPPPPIRLVRQGVSVTVPGSWHRGDCKDAVCAFSPSTEEHPNDSWVYLFAWKARTLDDATDRLLQTLGRSETTGLVHEPAEVDGRAAVRVRFAMAPKDTGPAEFEEFVVPGEGGIVIVAVGWRTPEGRAQLDSVLTTLRL